MAGPAHLCRRACVITVVGAIALLPGCNDDAARDAVHGAERARTSSAGRLADRACAEVADAIPAARDAVDAARRAVLRGDSDRAKQVIDRMVGVYIDHVTLEIRWSLKACRAALG